MKSLEGKCIEIDMLDKFNPKDWKMGNVVVIYSEGTTDCEDSCCEWDSHEECQDNRRFVIGENGVPFPITDRTIPLSFTKNVTNASEFYEYSKFYVEIGKNDIWVLEKYKKPLPSTIHFTLDFGNQLMETIFDLKNKKLPFKSKEKNHYSIGRELSYEEIMILDRYFKDPTKYYAYQFKIKNPLSYISMVEKDYHEKMILPTLPKGWAVGKYEIVTQSYYTVIIELFGLKSNHQKILPVIESFYHDAENISYSSTD